jgi:hypothetical protein
MNRTIRLLAMSGLGLGAVLAIGAGPACASTAAAPHAGHRATIQNRADWNDDNSDDVVGYFRTEIGCESVGRLGEFHGRWDDYDCSPVLFGFDRGAWVLEVATDDWMGNWNNDNWYDGCDTNWNGGDFHGGWDQ